MDANQFKAAIVGISESDLREAVDALERARKHAMQLKISARLPECAAFGAIAEDLEYSLGLICRFASMQPPAEIAKTDHAQTGRPVSSATSFDQDTVHGT